MDQRGGSNLESKIRVRNVKWSNIKKGGGPAMFDRKADCHLKFKTAMFDRKAELFYQIYVMAVLTKKL